MSCHLLTTVKAPAMSATEKEDHSMYMLRELVTIKVLLAPNSPIHMKPLLLTCRIWIPCPYLEIEGL